MAVSEMVERVARALAREQGSVVTAEIQADGSPHKIVEVWRDLIPFARAAIAAMREPTEAMIKDGETTIFEHMEASAAWSLDATKEGWQAMIDAALE